MEETMGGLSVHCRIIDPLVRKVYNVHLTGMFGRRNYKCRPNVEMFEYLLR
jgi:hypothetical protein